MGHMQGTDCRVDPINFEWWVKKIMTNENLLNVTRNWNGFQEIIHIFIFINWAQACSESPIFSSSGIM